MDIYKWIIKDKFGEDVIVYADRMTNIEGELLFFDKDDNHVAVFASYYSYRVAAFDDSDGWMVKPVVVSGPSDSSAHNTMLFGSCAKSISEAKEQIAFSIKAMG